MKKLKKIFMDEQQIRKIIREELSYLIKSDRFTFEKLIQLLDGRNIQTGRTTGTKFGIAIDNLLSFYGTTPVNQPDTVSDPSTSAGSYNQANAQEAVNAIKAIIDRLQELGLIA